MSRVGKAPIPIPQGVEININDGVISAKGPKGELFVNVSTELEYSLENSEITVTRPSDSKEHRSIHGLFRSLVANIVDGVSKGFEKKLEIVGVGYRAEMKGNKLLLNVGFSHPIIVLPPEGIEFSVEGNNQFTVKGIDKQLVGQMSAKIRSLRPPEPYKGKGIRYAGEQVRRKAGKTAA